MAEEVPRVDLGAVEAAVRRELGAHRGASEPGGLQVLGYGEMSTVIGWPAGSPAAACKRLPLFDDRDAAERYGKQFEAYLLTLEERGVTPLPSAFRTLGGAWGDERVSGYVVQPVIAAGTLGPEVLRSHRPDPGHPLVVGVTEAVLAVTDERTGLDAQMSNWALGHDGLRYLDVTTPLTFDLGGDLDMDLGLFLAAYPWLLRAVIGRLVAPQVIRAFREPRYVLVDMAGNLIKERLEAWVPAVLQVANEHISPPITPAEVHRFYRSDARLWEVMLRLRRADRWWQHNVRRRDYPNLLPGRIER